LFEIQSKKKKPKIKQKIGNGKTNEMRKMRKPGRNDDIRGRNILDGEPLQC